MCSIPRPHYHMPRPIFGSDAGCKDCRLMLEAIQICPVKGFVRATLDLRFKILNNDNKDKRLHIFLVYTFSTTLSNEPRWSQVVHRPLLPNSTASEDSFLTIKKWLEECLQHHEPCGKGNATRLPNRVIEISEHQVYLREQQQISGADNACLIHSWGKHGAALQLRRDNMEALVGRIARARLPKTFRDAVDICSKLNISYTWIDEIF
ncbi:hypothetical protein HBI24_091340 [Parastagonospora nodorum]|nr:hypothetical protein HBI09_076380 [Parastagonospora nodorum]KAH4051885.1 hypothetical protein HBH49_109240 [Parastagonospora nodorum]KAH4167131.1 hypothetical protein HBH43_133630 [Parastagonospora nodorum]KAH5015824.1 hypothetical protein HBI77_061450 [Parastagonospora nodorum]KAH5027956.1 hypothetical protein HBI74_114690 [Parastagonospora nodorum]